MLMPETSIYKYDRFVFRQNDIGATWERFHVFAISKSFRKEIFSHFFLRLSICAAYMGHILAAYFLTMIISHIALLIEYALLVYAAELY